jgi:7,8-dihydroneopterin aldolase/epimerase/oxygenase
MSDDRILLEEMVFYGYHGDRAPERDLGQRFVVDLELGLDTSLAGRSDQLTDTVDYVRIYEAVRRVVEGPPCNLLEAVAERIAAAALAEARVEWVRVRLAKPGVALHGALRGAAVQIIRTRPV